KRKKFEPASMARPAASASSIFLDDVIPLLPSAAGQSLWSMTRIGRTSHQIGGVFTRLLSTTWLWLGVGTNTGAVGGPGIFPSATRVADRSTEDACMVQVPGTGLFGSGHCVEIAWFTRVFHASGRAPNREMSFDPNSDPHSSPGLPQSGQGMAWVGSRSLSTENIGTRTYRCAVCLMSRPVGSAVGSVTGWQIGVCISLGSDCAMTPLKSRSMVGSSMQ